MKLDQFRQKINNFCTPDAKESFVKKSSALFGRNLVIVISNVDPDNVAQYTLFAPNAYGFDADNNIKVTMSPSHVQVKRDIAASPFVTGEVKYRTSDDINLSNPITYVKLTDTGVQEFALISPLNYLEPENEYITGESVIRITDFEGLKFDGDCGLRGNLEPGSSITFMMPIKEQVQLKNILLNEDVILKSNSPGPIIQEIEILNPTPKCDTYNV